MPTGWKGNTMSLVSIQDVRKSFGALEVLKGVSVEIGRGDVVAIIGKSGSGKSTLLRCINGLETYDQGSIVVDGINVGASKDNLRNLRRNVGMVFQQFNLFPHLTAAENVMLAPKVVNRENPHTTQTLAQGDAGQGRPVGKGRQLPLAALRRPAAARRHCSRPGDAAERAAVRRDHLGARSGAGQRGAARGRERWPKTA